MGALSAIARALVKDQRSPLGMRYLFFFVLTVSSPSEAAFNQLVINASRLSGVAPLAVYFDSIGSTSTLTTRPYHEIHFSWDFGDPSAGTWATVGLDKNLAHGPLAAHLFEQPGIYTVTLTATDPSGVVAIQTVQVNVEDPNVVFNASDTICVRSSAASDFAGCPAGALPITSADFDAVFSAHLAPGRRILFRRGDSFQNSATTELGSGPVSIGAFGVGNRPFIDSNVAGESAVFDLGNFNPPRSADDIRISDFNFDGNLATWFIVRHTSNGTISNVAVINTIGRNFNSNLGWLTDSGSPQDVHRNIFFIENDWQAYGTHALFLGVKESAVLGNTFTLHPNFQGTNAYRLHYVNRVVNSYNIHAGANPGGSVVKFAGNENYVTGATDYQYFYFSHNRISGGEDQTMQMRVDKNSHELGIMEDFLFENNYHVRDGNGYGGTLIRQIVDKMTIRNSIFDLTSDSGIGPAVMTDTGGGLTAQNAMVYNNTCYDADSSPDWCIRLTVGTGHRAESNLYYSPAGNNGRVLQNVTGAVEANNFQTATNPFSSSIFQSPFHFMLNPTSPVASSVVNGAPCVSGIQLDFFGNHRPSGGQCDIGAHEISVPSSQLSPPGMPQVITE